MFLQNLHIQMLGYTVLTRHSKVTSIVCPRLALNKKLHLCSALINYALFISYKLPSKTGIEGKIKGEMEVTRRRGRRRKKLLDDLKDRRGYSHLKEEALDRTMWRNHFRGGFGPVVRQNTE